jgi:hypothetical protein
MLRYIILAVLLVSTSVVSANAQSTLPAIAPKVPCASLRGFDLQIAEAPTQISDAKESLVGGKMTCVVRGYVSPQVQFEVRMPVSGWTQRYLQTGCGGLCGNLRIDAPQRPCPMLERSEFALASTDMGHEGNGGMWAVSDPQLRVDFAYRGVHATALVAKALIAQYYGQPPKFSYFSGCSDGGREGLIEAQRYPNDFDGIAAGAAALNFLVQNSFYHAWNARVVAPERGKPPVLTTDDLAILHQAAIAACDASDGTRDNIISDPPACKFDPGVTECRGGPQIAKCLSHAAVEAAREIYRGAHDVGGQKLVIGALQPGSELAWAGVFIPRSPQEPIGSAMFASDMLRGLAYWQPLPAGWDIYQFQFTTDALKGLMPTHGLYDATDPDLSAFAKHGGKLLMWHGWSDPHISPLNSIAYAQAVADQLGADASRNLLRLFLIPGMYHCGGGDGMTSVDILSPLIAWVENGKAPDSLVASRNDSDASVGRGRTLYAFPATSVLAAGADPNNPSAWHAGSPLAVPTKLYASWAGAELFKPGYEQQCGFVGQTFVCKPTR